MSYESIATATGGSSTIVFSSIPSTYKHLQIRTTLRNSVGADFVSIRFNSDTGSNYEFIRMYAVGGNGTSRNGVSVNNYLATTYIEVPGQAYLGLDADVYQGAIINIYDYLSTSKNKTILMYGGFAGSNSSISCLWGGTWNSTATISNIILTAGGTSGSFVSNSRASLYGLKG